MKKFFYLLIFIFFFSGICAHPWRPNHYVIIDTDGGFDDFRAITMLLVSPEIRVMGITASNGVLGAGDAYYKVQALLNDLYHEGIPVGINNNTDAISKNCKTALEFQWGAGHKLSDSLISAIDLINDLLSRANDKVELICLGSLNTAKCLMESNGFNKDKLKRIIWTSNYDYLGANFNYKTDTISFHFIEKQDLPFEIITGELNNYGYTPEFYEQLQTLSGIYAAKFSESLTKEKDPHFSLSCFDESAALYLHYNSMFIADTVNNISRYKLKGFISNGRIENDFIKIITGQTIVCNQNFSVFPVDTSYYFKDIQIIMPETIRKYGMDEWISCVITNELHRHLGIYSIIGAKMGIRAREYFGIGADEMELESFAGTVPPFSCMNDGLQVSTGGTLGHGLITVFNGSQHEPKATFTYLDRKITISLKKEYREKMVKEIKDILAIYSLDSNIYWELVRIAALNYWENWDRHQIFDISAE